MSALHLGLGSSLAQRASAIHLHLDAWRSAVHHRRPDPLPIALGNRLQRDLVAVLLRAAEPAFSALRLLRTRHVVDKLDPANAEATARLLVDARLQRFDATVGGEEGANGFGCGRARVACDQDG